MAILMVHSQGSIGAFGELPPQTGEVLHISKRRESAFSFRDAKILALTDDKGFILVNADNGDVYDIVPEATEGSIPLTSVFPEVAWFDNVSEARYGAATVVEPIGTEARVNVAIPMDDETVEGLSISFGLNFVVASRAVFLAFDSLGSALKEGFSERPTRTEVQNMIADVGSPVSEELVRSIVDESNAKISNAVAASVVSSIAATAIASLK